MKLITGMHRSGTSMMAQLCHEAGGDLGDEETFYKGDKWNPNGYFEQLDIHQANIPLVNGSLGKLSYFNLPSKGTILKRAAKHETLIKSLDKKYRNKIIKENRFCLTMPAWELYGAQFEKVLICLREPIQVANSIKKRNKTIVLHGLHLWYIHNIRLLESLGNKPVWFVNYSNLINKKTSFVELKNVFRFLELNVSDEKIIELTEKVINPNMNNNPITDFAYTSKVDTLWKKLLSMYKQQTQV